MKQRIIEQQIKLQKEQEAIQKQKLEQQQK